jgi:dUTPase
VFTPYLGVQVIPTGVYGSLPQGIRGFQVYPGVIDEDYTREIKIMAQAPSAFVAVSPENKIVQLVIHQM